MSTRKQLKQLVEARNGLIVPGAFNALSAKVIADLGFKAIYVTGAGVTNMWFGMPDQGFMGLHEIADQHRQALRAALAKGHLDRAIAVVIDGFDLGDPVVGHIEHCYGNGIAIFRKNARHADLAADQTD